MGLSNKRTVPPSAVGGGLCVGLHGPRLERAAVGAMRPSNVHAVLLSAVGGGLCSGRRRPRPDLAAGAL